MFIAVPKIAFSCLYILYTHVEAVVELMICLNNYFLVIGSVVDDYKLEFCFTFTSIAQKHFHAFVKVS